MATKEAPPAGAAPATTQTAPPPPATTQTAPPSPAAPKKKSNRKPVDPNESKLSRFIRITNNRVPKVLKSLSIIGNLGGPNYESTDDQRQKIQAAIQSAVDEMIINLNRTSPKSSVSFKL